MPPPRSGASWCAGLTAMVDRRPQRIYGGDLPTARTTLRNGYVRVLVFCNSCRHQADADLQKIVESGRGDVSLTELRFRCSQCGTDRTDFVVTSRDNPQPR
jgi:transposase-like protein